MRCDQVRTMRPAGHEERVRVSSNASDASFYTRASGARTTSAECSGEPDSCTTFAHCAREQLRAQWVSQREERALSNQCIRIRGCSWDPNDMELSTSFEGWIVLRCSTKISLLLIWQSEKAINTGIWTLSLNYYWIRFRDFQNVIHRN